MTGGQRVPFGGQTRGGDDAGHLTTNGLPPTPTCPVRSFCTIVTPLIPLFTFLANLAPSVLFHRQQLTLVTPFSPLFAPCHHRSLFLDRSEAEPADGKASLTCHGFHCCPWNAVWALSAYIVVLVLASSSLPAPSCLPSPASEVLR